MPKFVITEIWTRTRVVDAPNETAALNKGEPDKHPLHLEVGRPSQLLDELNAHGRATINLGALGLNLSNWHATEVK